MKKYELTDEAIKIEGRILYRIKALVDFAGVKAGDLGGFVEIKEDSYKVYKSEDKAVEGAKLEYLMSAFFDSMISADGADIQYALETPDYAPAINATDYYGII